MLTGGSIIGKRKIHPLRVHHVRQCNCSGPLVDVIDMRIHIKPPAILAKWIQPQRFSYGRQNSGNSSSFPFEPARNGYPQTSRSKSSQPPPPRITVQTGSWTKYVVSRPWSPPENPQRDCQNRAFQAMVETGHRVPRNIWAMCGSSLCSGYHVEHASHKHNLVLGTCGATQNPW